MSPLEAMARAICVTDFGNWDALSDRLRNHYVSQARAALTALRDCGVTEGMIDAYYAVPVTLGDGHGGETCYAAAEFRAMLDAALQE